MRQIAEKARQLGQHYCEKNSLQYISISRLKSRFKFSKRLGLYIASSFALEFSSNGEDSYIGELMMEGIKLKDVHLPPYRIN